LFTSETMSKEGIGSLEFPSRNYTDPVCAMFRAGVD